MKIGSSDLPWTYKVKPYDAVKPRTEGPSDQKTHTTRNNGFNIVTLTLVFYKIDVNKNAVAYF